MTHIVLARSLLFAILALALVALCSGQALPAIPTHVETQQCIENSTKALSRADKLGYRPWQLHGENAAAYVRENGPPAGVETDDFQIYAIFDSTGETVQIWVIEHGCVVSFSDIVATSVLDSMLYNNGGYRAKGDPK